MNLHRSHRLVVGSMHRLNANNLVRGYKLSRSLGWVLTHWSFSADYTPLQKSMAFTRLLVFVLGAALLPLLFSPGVEVNLSKTAVF
jgi:hypothetical protein